MDRSDALGPLAFGSHQIKACPRLGKIEFVRRVPYLSSRRDAPTRIETERGLNKLRNLWTAEQIEQLKTLAGTISSKDIGLIVGRSKDAVVNKMAAMGLPRFAVTFDNKTEAPKKRVREKKPEKKPAPVKTAPARPVRTEPMQARFKNHEAAAKAERAKAPATPSRIEWCKMCGAPVSNWIEHEERQGHGRTI